MSKGEEGNDALEGDDDEEEKDPFEEEDASDNEEVDDDDDDEDEVEKMFGKRHDGRGKNKNKQKSSSFSKKENDMSKRVSTAQLYAFISDILRYLHVFWERPEDYPSESIADALVGALSLAMIRNSGNTGTNKSGSDSVIFVSIISSSRKALVELANSSGKGTIAVYRALTPAMTMIGRDPRFPDGFKVTDIFVCERFVYMANYISCLYK
jgi:hypothetical protein